MIFYIDYSEYPGTDVAVTATVTFDDKMQYEPDAIMEAKTMIAEWYDVPVRHVKTGEEVAQEIAADEHHHIENLLFVTAPDGTGLIFDK